MTCICGHSKDEHVTVYGETPCFHVNSIDGDFYDYCPCMKYEADEQADPAAVLEEYEKAKAS